jgi:peptidoglycan/xylan/chitin deacetylase (PgdA/CDA1 family)
MGGLMSSDHEPTLSRAAMTRRVLLAAGGLVLLGECAACAGAGVTLGQPRPAQGVSAAPAVHGGTGRPHAAANADARAMATRRPRRSNAAATGHPATTPPPGRPETTAPADGQPLYHLTDGPKVIALTIDDGPSPAYTPQILSLLHRYGITATFSMIGRNVAANPGLAREVTGAGHLIVNHTWTHANLTVLAPTAVADQMNRTSDIISNVTGTRPGIFRAPYGAWSPAVLANCRQMRLMPLDWSVDPRDWARPGVAAIAANIMRNTRTGSIILEHDGGGNRAQTVAALKLVLPRLLAQGYQFRTP